MIDTELAGFLREGLSIHLATRDARLQPSGARAAAIQVDADGRHVVVFVPDRAAARILPDLESNAQAAVSYARASDDRAGQLKGVVTDIRAAAPAEQPLVATQWQAFMRELELVGIPRDFALGWATWPAVAIRIRVTSVFEQTPGPKAGTPIS